MLIDWVSAKVPLMHDGMINNGHVVSVKADGKMEWTKAKRLSVEGSHESSISVLSDGRDFIEFSGNPVKFLQGHNVFGSTDLIGLVHDTMHRICELLKIVPAAPDVQKWLAGDYTLSRIDLTDMLKLETKADCLNWIRAASHLAHIKRRGQGVLKGDTLYFGKTSRRWSLKFYSKGQEITVPGHVIPFLPELRQELIEWVQPMLRREITLRGMELRDKGIYRAADFGATLLKPLFESYMEKLNLSGTLTLPPELLNELPRNYRRTYVAWKHGEDLRQTLSKNTFYAHRRALLAHGVDIAVKQTADHPDNVVPLLRVLEAVSAPIPEWAYGTSLYYQPSPRKIA